MKNYGKWSLLTTVLIAIGLLPPLLCSGGAETVPSKPIKRIGMVVGIKPDKIAECKQLHADSNPGVRDLLTKYHMQNFSIYLQSIAGKPYEFGYYEYTGDDFDGDMAKLAAEPRNIAAQAMRSDATAVAGREKLDQDGAGLLQPVAR